VKGTFSLKGTTFVYALSSECLNHWFDTTKESDLLEIVQIEAGRIITCLRCNSSRQKLYHELGWKTLENRRNKHKLILFYIILNGLTPL
jgi:hypothetical protein